MANAKKAILQTKQSRLRLHKQSCSSVGRAAAEWSQYGGEVRRRADASQVRVAVDVVVAEVRDPLVAAGA